MGIEYLRSLILSHIALNIPRMSRKNSYIYGNSKTRLIIVILVPFSLLLIAQNELTVNLLALWILPSVAI